MSVNNRTHESHQVSCHANTSQNRHIFNHGIMEDERVPLLSSSIQEFGSARLEPIVSGKTSFLLSVFNLMNAVLGSAILVLPYAMAQSGAILFSLMLLVIAIVANYTIHLLLKMCELTGHISYEDIGYGAMGIPGKLMAACAILLQNVGSMSSYLFIVKDELPAVIKTLLCHDQCDDTAWFVNGDYLVLLLIIFIILPLACLPKIGFLGYTSAFSILCMVFFTIGIVYEKLGFPCPIPILSEHNHTVDVLEPTALMVSHYSNVDFLGEVYHRENHTSKCKAKLFSISLQTAYMIPTMVFSFVCHPAVLPIYAELSRPSKDKMQSVAVTSITVCFVMYIVTSLFGYLTFYDDTSSDILSGYSLYLQDDMLILIIRIAVLLAIIFTVPIAHYPARISFMMIAGTAFPSLCNRFPWKLYFVTTFILLTLVTMLTIFVPNILEIFGIIGGTASTSLVLFLPSLFYLKLSEEELYSRSKIIALILLLVSIALLILSLTTIFYGIISKDT